jgi:hypothetical protein
MSSCFITIFRPEIQYGHYAYLEPGKHFSGVGKCGYTGDERARIILMSNTWADVDVNERHERVRYQQCGTDGTSGSSSQPPG